MPAPQSESTQGSALEALTSPLLDPLFWIPEQLGSESAWWSHAPFVFWLVAASRPALIVEAGGPAAPSYAAFCEAVLRAGLGTRCYAIHHAPAGGESKADEAFRRLHDRRYQAFSTLVGPSPNGGPEAFRDASIDLLHLAASDGSGPARPFEAWRAKLSRRAIVLVDGTHGRDHAPARFFGDLSGTMPSFEFPHGAGLGVLAVGIEAAPAVQQLCTRLDDREIGAVRARFAHLGARWAPSAGETAPRPGDLEAGQRDAIRATVQEAVADQAAELAGMREALAMLSRRHARSAGGDRRPLRLRPSFGAFCAELVNPRLRRKRVARRRHEEHVTEAIARSIFFDADWYLARYPDVASRGVDPARHYAMQGGAEGRDPGPLFPTARYLDENPEVAASGLNPLHHFLERSEIEGFPFPLRPRSAHAARAAPARRPRIIYVSGEAHTPGHRYRVERYVDAASLCGWDASWIRIEDLAQRLEAFDACDMLVAWRARWGADLERAMKRARAAGATVVLDVDDLMIDPELARPSIVDGMRSHGIPEEVARTQFADIRQTMLAADICFATTEELAVHMRSAGKVVHVLPNGFDLDTYAASRRAARRRRQSDDGMIRLGYAGGSRTHQRDFGVAVEAVARLLREHERCRLVLFRTADGTPLVDVEEYPALAALGDRIEWRPLQPLDTLPRELARFDVNLAPLEFGNPFCEAKSELKFFEAALVDVPTVASPTGPFRRAIAHGRTGLLAASADDWYVQLKRLVEDAALRDRLARAAHRSALAAFGPLQRAARLARTLLQRRADAGTIGFALDAALARSAWSPPALGDSEVVFEADRLGDAELTVVIPLYNYASFVVEALDSVRAQTLALLDVVVVDDRSTDDSLAAATAWAAANAGRFNRILVLSNKANLGLAMCRNVGFDAADTAFVLALDADNRLLPACCATLLAALRGSGAAYAYPTLRQFGLSTAIMGDAPYDPQRFVGGNSIDALALIAKEAWAVAGGYRLGLRGWEDYDLWCRLAERGFSGRAQREVLAEYRVHGSSMLRRHTDLPEVKRDLCETFEARHPWLSLIEGHRGRQAPRPRPQLTEAADQSRLDLLLPLLRCPETGLTLTYETEATALVTIDGSRRWPIVAGRPVFSRAAPEIRPADHQSNLMPQKALDLIREATGLVLNLSAGGTAERFDRVVEVEFAVFRHTDVVADAHRLPFDENAFDAVIVMNAFEHYREPHTVAAEVWRVLKPGGRVLVHTAFLQPLHEAPWHFFNCTRFGLAEWFKAFETLTLEVSENFQPNRSVGWLAHEVEVGVRSSISEAAGDAFAATSIGAFSEAWRTPERRGDPAWTSLEGLPQAAQQGIAAGFEFLGRKPSAGRAAGD